MSGSNHKNHGWALAWLDGEEVEYKNRTLDGAWDGWMPVDTLHHFECDQYVFRIKPKKAKTVGYKRYVWKNFEGALEVDVVQDYPWRNGENTNEFVREVQASRDFVKWLDECWVYDDVDLPCSEGEQK